MSGQFGQQGIYNRPRRLNWGHGGIYGGYSSFTIVAVPPTASSVIVDSGGNGDNQAHEVGDSVIQISSSFGGIQKFQTGYPLFDTNDEFTTTPQNNAITLLTVKASSDHVGRYNAMVHYIDLAPLKLALDLDSQLNVRTGFTTSNASLLIRELQESLSYAINTQWNLVIPRAQSFNQALANSGDATLNEYDTHAPGWLPTPLFKNSSFPPILVSLAGCNQLCFHVNPHYENGGEWANYTQLKNHLFMNIMTPSCGVNFNTSAALFNDPDNIFPSANLVKQEVAPSQFKKTQSEGEGQTGWVARGPYIFGFGVKGPAGTPDQNSYIDDYSYLSSNDVPLPLLFNSPTRITVAGTTDQAFAQMRMFQMKRFVCAPMTAGLTSSRYSLLSSQNVCKNQQSIAITNHPNVAPTIIGIQFFSAAAPSLPNRVRSGGPLLEASETFFPMVVEMNPMFNIDQLDFHFQTEWSNLRWNAVTQSIMPVILFQNAFRNLYQSVYTSSPAWDVTPTTATVVTLMPTWMHNAFLATPSAVGFSEFPYLLTGANWYLFADKNSITPGGSFFLQYALGEDLENGVPTWNFPAAATRTQFSRVIGF